MYKSNGQELVAVMSFLKRAFGWCEKAGYMYLPWIHLESCTLKGK